MYNDEYTVVLGDWFASLLTIAFCQDLTMDVRRYHTEHEPLLKHFMSIANPGGAEPVPDAPLMYFAHGDSYLPPISSAAPTVSPSTSSVGFNENATLPFESGKTYRLRVSGSLLACCGRIMPDTIGARISRSLSTLLPSPPCIFGSTATTCASLRSTGSVFRPLLAGLGIEQLYRPTSSHIQSNGSTLQLLNAIPSLSLQRMTRARTGLSMPIWIPIWFVPRASRHECTFSTPQFDTVPTNLNPNATASITYSSSNSLTNLSPVPLEFYQYTDETVFVPSKAEPQLPPPDQVVELEVTFDTMDDGTNHAMFNSKTFNMPKVPTVFTQVEYATQNISAFTVLTNI